MATAHLNLSDGAKLVLLELEAPPGTPISSRGLADTLVGVSPRQIGAYLRELRNAGLAVALDADTHEPLDRVASGQRAVWVATSRKENV